MRTGRDSSSEGYSGRLTLIYAAVLALTVGLAAHLLHVGHHADAGGGWFHWLRDSALAIPLAALVLWAVNDVSSSLRARRPLVARVRWALMAGLGYSIALVPGGMAHAKLFPAEHHGGSALLHALSDAVALLPSSLYTALAVAVVLGTPLERVRPIVSLARSFAAAVRSFRWQPAHSLSFSLGRGSIALATFLAILPAPAIAGPNAVTDFRLTAPDLPVFGADHPGAAICTAGNTVFADVV
ncbi:MAG TPA: hypothetical protein VIY70_03380, partial [Acidimicrobiia bacterium]